MEKSPHTVDFSDRILITGHRNPDTDSVCAAAAYADLKNTISTGEHYTAIRCGNINDQTEYVFSRAGLPLPLLVTDIRPRAVTVALTDIPRITEDTSVYAALRILDENTLSILPVTDNCGNFIGLLSIDEIAEFFIQNDISERPVYRFLTANFGETVPGEFHKKGEIEFTAPIMIGAMPFDTSVERINSIIGGLPILITGLRPDIIGYAVEREFPAIILTGCEENVPVDLFRGYHGNVYVSHIDTAETVRRLRISTPVSPIVNRNPLTIDSDELFAAARDKLINSHYRGLPVMNGSDFCGIVTRRCFISKPGQKLIMVDHNEPAQSVTGADGADIIEIIDHHRLDAPSTMTPILIDVRPYGSTCTVVYSHFCAYGIRPQKNTALLLLSGILSDTVCFKSPTTTEFDRTAASELAAAASVDAGEWGLRLFEHTSSLVTDDYRKLVLSDFKIYTEEEISAGIGQVEVSTFQDFEEAEEPIISALEEIRFSRELNWTMLMVTNVMKEESILVMSGDEKFSRHLTYEQIHCHSFLLKGVLSRKKQLLPEILRVIHETAAAGKE